MCVCFFFFKQKTAYEMRISDWSSDVCSSDLKRHAAARPGETRPAGSGKSRTGKGRADARPRSRPQRRRQPVARAARRLRRRWQCPQTLGRARKEKPRRRRAPALSGQELQTHPSPGRRLREQGRSRKFLRGAAQGRPSLRSEEHTSELQSLMRISYAVFCLKINTTTHAVVQNKNILNYNNHSTP